MKNILSEEYKNKIKIFRGEAGQEWLDSLASEIARYEEIWDISVQEPFELSYNFVAPAVSNDGKKAVIKISFPDNKEFESEIQALNHFPSQVAIKVIQHDLENGVVLLEQAEPGTSVGKIESDENQISILCNVIRKLHKPLSQQDVKLFSSLQNWYEAFNRYEERHGLEQGPIPANVFDLGKQLFKNFLEEKTKQVLLHGDLHNNNILESERGWLVIDPKGVVGDSCFELGTFLRNPLYDLPENSDYKKVLTRRFEQCTDELTLDKEQIRLWTLANSILSMVWFDEDEGAVSDLYLRNTELIQSISF